MNPEDFEAQAASEPIHGGQDAGAGNPLDKEPSPHFFSRKARLERLRSDEALLDEREFGRFDQMMQTNTPVKGLSASLYRAPKYVWKTPKQALRRPSEVPRGGYRLEITQSVVQLEDAAKVTS